MNIQRYKLVPAAATPPVDERDGGGGYPSPRSEVEGTVYDGGGEYVPMESEEIASEGHGGLGDYPQPGSAHFDEEHTAHSDEEIPATQSPDSVDHTE